MNTENENKIEEQEGGVLEFTPVFAEKLEVPYQITSLDKLEDMTKVCMAVKDLTFGAAHVLFTLALTAPLWLPGRLPMFAGALGLTYTGYCLVRLSRWIKSII